MTSMSSRRVSLVVGEVGAPPLGVHVREVDLELAPDRARLRHLEIVVVGVDVGESVRDVCERAFVVIKSLVSA
jgi:hypothetical protein